MDDFSKTEVYGCNTYSTMSNELDLVDKFFWTDKRFVRKVLVKSPPPWLRRYTNRTKNKKISPFETWYLL